jgi:hypothetical protein
MSRESICAWHWVSGGGSSRSATWLCLVELNQPTYSNLPPCMHTWFLSCKSDTFGPVIQWARFSLVVRVGYGLRHSATASQPAKRTGPCPQKQVSHLSDPRYILPRPQTACSRPLASAPSALRSSISSNLRCGHRLRAGDPSQRSTVQPPPSSAQIATDLVNNQESFRQYGSESNWTTPSLLTCT